MPTARRLEQLVPRLARLSVEVAIDRVGSLPAALGTEPLPFPTRLRLLDGGRIWVKLCSYRVSSAGAPWDDVVPDVAALTAAAPERCVWGTDWQHPGMSPVANAGRLLDQLFAWVPDAEARRRILEENPCQLYGFPITTH